LKRLSHPKSAFIFPAIALFLSYLVPIVMFPATVLAADVNGDFSLKLDVNGLDMLASQAFSVTPDETLVFNCYIYDVHAPVEMQRLTVEIFFAGIPAGTITQELGRVVNPGETYRPEIKPVSARDYLSIWGVNITTGKYKAIVKLEYGSRGQTKSWAQSRDIEVPGNPATTIAGVVTAVVTGVALLGLIPLLKSWAGYRLATQPLTSKKLIESRARSNISSSLVTAVKKIVIKDRCPICGDAIKHGFCRTCGKPAKELQRSYRRKVHDLAAAGIKLLADGEAKSIEELPQKLDMSGALAKDVTAAIRNYRLFQAKKAARALTTSALLTGLSSAVAGILGVTIGGLAALNTTSLVAILVLSFLVPAAITGILRIRMRNFPDRIRSGKPQAKVEQGSSGETRTIV
jgi:hypothetical protein